MTSAPVSLIGIATSVENKADHDLRRHGDCAGREGRSFVAGEAAGYDGRVVVGRRAGARVAFLLNRVSLADGLADLGGEGDGLLARGLDGEGARLILVLPDLRSAELDALDLAHAG